MRFKLLIALVDDHLTKVVTEAARDEMARVIREVEGIDVEDAYTAIRSGRQKGL